MHRIDPARAYASTPKKSAIAWPAFPKMRTSAASFCKQSTFMSDARPGLFQLQEVQTTSSVRIFCPDCDYDLTGLAENRCPECGQEFDAARLNFWTTEQGLPLTAGPRRDVGYMA